MNRREFITLLGGVVATWPVVGWAQRSERIRRVGVLSEFSEAQMKPLIGALREQLRSLGWKDDDLHFDLRVAIVDAAQFQANSAALVGTSPDVIVALGSRALGALKKETTTIPVVFNFVADPVAQGFVQSLARPGGNLTGLTNFEFSFAGKWLEALKEVEPGVKRVLLLVNPQNSGTLGLSKFVESLGPSHGVEMVPGPIRTVAEIESTLNSFGAGSAHAVIVLPDGLTVTNRDAIIGWANRTRVPIIFPFRVFAESGGLMSWGLDFAGVYRQVATYVDRILRGYKPADLPVQAPNKFELVINLKAARAIGLTVPPTLLTLADEVIE